MRAVIQRVTSASVAGAFSMQRVAIVLSHNLLYFIVVDSETVSSIGRGLMVLVGIGTGQSPNASSHTTLH